ncbi:MAG TPA: hypothetical protein VLJ59_09860 [Mycobacteriales bacterium]|nr:hypothetical protein [Mycobacteriales bacterium]
MLYTTRVVRLAGPVAGITAAAILLAGCNSKSATPTAQPTSSTSAGSTAATGPASPPANAPLTSLTAEQILDRAKQALVAAGSVRVRGGLSSGATALGFDVQMSTTTGAGTVRMPQGTFQAIVTETETYLKADPRFWSATLGPAAATKLAGRWLRPKVDNQSLKSIAALFRLREFGDGVLSPSGSLTKGKIKLINGQPAIAVSDSTGPADGRGTLWIATRGRPYPLRLDGGTNISQGLMFSDFGQPVRVTAPPAAEVVDEASLGN